MRDCCAAIDNLVYVQEPGLPAYLVCLVCGARHYCADVATQRVSLDLGSAQ